MDISYQGNTNTGKDEWLTPPEIIKACGKFDLDPCAPIVRPWDTAKKHYTIEDNGLIQTWKGRVWCNPPYNNCQQWFNLCADHGNATGICFVRTETQWFFDTIWRRAYAIKFLEGRVNHYHVDGTRGGSPGLGSVLIAWDLKNAQKLRLSKLPGKYIVL